MSKLPFKKTGRSGGKAPPSVPTSLGLGYLPIFRCSYCTGTPNKGIVEVDLAAVLALPNAEGTIDIDLRDRHAPKLFIFDRDANGNHPCRHVIDMAIHTRAFYATWQHNWIARHDAHDQLVEHAWALQDGDADDDGIIPGDDFDLVRLVDDSSAVEYRLSDPPRVLQFYGDLLTAKDPLKFLKKLSASLNRAS